MDTPGLFFSLVVGVIIIVQVLVINRADQAVATANAQYHQTLADLRADPGNTQIRAGVIAYGRVYAIIARQYGQRLRFDELALATDLLAIPVPVPLVEPAPAASRSSAEDRLWQLGWLRDEHLISTDEHATRQQIIYDGEAALRESLDNEQANSEQQDARAALERLEAEGGITEK